MTLFKVAAGAAILLLAGLIWPEGDRENSENVTGSTVQNARPVHE